MSEAETPTTELDWVDQLQSNLSRAKGVAYMASSSQMGDESASQTFAAIGDYLEKAHAAAQALEELRAARESGAAQKTPQAA